MITVDYNGSSGHTARCSSCGWESKIYPSSDTAFAKSKNHKCQEKKSL